MTPVLLDTHVFLWALLAPERLEATAWDVLRDTRRPLHLSMVSVWEMAIKASRGKLELPGGVERFVAEGTRHTGVALLDIRLAHIARLPDLPLHHRDPFDRLLIAQAQVERFQLMSYDRVFASYDFDRLA